MYLFKNFFSCYFFVFVLFLHSHRKYLTPSFPFFSSFILQFGHENSELQKTSRILFKNCFSLSHFRAKYVFLSQIQRVFDSVIKPRISICKSIGSHSTADDELPTREFSSSFHIATFFREDKNSALIFSCKRINDTFPKKSHRDTFYVYCVCFCSFMSYRTPMYQGCHCMMY